MEFDQIKELLGGRVPYVQTAVGRFLLFGNISCLRDLRGAQGQGRNVLRGISAWGNASVVAKLQSLIRYDPRMQPRQKTLQIASRPSLGMDQNLSRNTQHRPNLVINQYSLHPIISVRFSRRKRDQKQLAFPHLLAWVPVLHKLDIMGFMVQMSKLLQGLLWLLLRCFGRLSPF